MTTQAATPTGNLGFETVMATQGNQQLASQRQQLSGDAGKSIIKSVDQLKNEYPEFHKMLLVSMAQVNCRKQQEHNQRMKKIRLEHERH